MGLPPWLGGGGPSLLCDFSPAGQLSGAQGSQDLSPEWAPAWALTTPHPSCAHLAALFFLALFFLR